jgi:hypothetical protein
MNIATEICGKRILDLGCCCSSSSQSINQSIDRSINQSTLELEEF